MCTYYIVAVTPEACVLFSAHVFSMIGPVGGFRMEFITNVDRILLNTVYECDTVLPTVTPRSPFNNSSRSASITAALWSEEYMNKAFDAVCVHVCEIKPAALPNVHPLSPHSLPKWSWFCSLTFWLFFFRFFFFDLWFCPNSVFSSWNDKCFPACCCFCQKEISSLLLSYKPVTVQTSFQQIYQFSASFITSDSY